MWSSVTGFFHLPCFQGSFMLYRVTILHSFSLTNIIPLDRYAIFCVLILPLLFSNKAQTCSVFISLLCDSGEGDLVSQDDFDQPKPISLQYPPYNKQLLVRDRHMPNTGPIRMRERSYGSCSGLMKQGCVHLSLLNVNKEAQKTFGKQPRVLGQQKDGL